MKTNLLDITSALNIGVFKVGWDLDVSGAIKPTEEGYKIFVNECHCVERKRFTVAYELSHYILHKDILGDGVVHDQLYRSCLDNKLEKDALSYTMDLLCPWYFMNHYIENGVSEIEALAKLFGVTNSTMSIRLGMPFEK